MHPGSAVLTYPIFIQSLCLRCMAVSDESDPYTFRVELISRTISSITNTPVLKSGMITTPVSVSRQLCRLREGAA